MRGGCLGAFFRLTQARLPDQDAIALAADARGAAEVARHAGSAAALASLEATPAAMLRLASARDRAHWWAGLIRLAREASDCVSLLAANIPTVLAACDGEAFESFVAAGLKAAGPDRKKRAAFFSLADPAARRLLERAGGRPGFDDVERRLKLYGRALWGTTPRLAALEGVGHAPAPQRVSIAGGLIRLPHVFRGVAATRTEPLYRAALAHAQAHLAFGTRQSPKRLRPLQIAMICVIEDARVEALATRRFPGLRALWTPWHEAAPGDAMTAAGLMARLSRALLDPLTKTTTASLRRGEGFSRRRTGASTTRPCPARSAGCSATTWARCGCASTRRPMWSSRSIATTTCISGTPMIRRTKCPTRSSRRSTPHGRRRRPPTTAARATRRRRSRPAAPAKSRPTSAVR
ncbi:hypothetical protein [Chenggangzhangella methanolivorans]|uniref:hypothetical protein n=1 Tax=Chenggangzhangella methanolivorans TaxID=1437009 RepID=UPI0021BCFD46|nr:hypothetical protein [Chenggangzhangella methanolivorans]